MIYDIFPVKGLEGSNSFANSRKMLSFHSDGSAHPLLSPDFILLYCVRSDPNALNLLADLDELIAVLRAKTVDVLMRPVFQHLVSTSPICYINKPVIVMESERTIIAYDEDNVRGVDDRAINAQRLLSECLQKIAIKIINYNNSLLIIKNKRCFHARTSFFPKFDGRDRWIKCAFVTKQDFPNGSIFPLSS